MKLSSLARWLAVPLALGVGAAGGVAATRWSGAKPWAARSDQANAELPLPPGFFDHPVADPKDGPAPEPVKVGQVLVIEVLEALPGRPITGERIVRPDGTIGLGFYGDLRVAGLDRNQIKVKLLEHLREFINDEVLGLYRLNRSTGKPELVKPINSGRVFVDDSTDQFIDRKQHRQAAGDEEIRGRIANLERAVQELRASRPGPGSAASE
jgi:hypothetical protein